MCGYWSRDGWRAAAAVALVVAGAWLAVAFVPHAVGGVGFDPVVTDPGPPPSVDAFRENPRKRYRNALTNRVFAFAPLAVPAVGAFAGFVAAGGRRDRRDRRRRGVANDDGGAADAATAGWVRDAVDVAARIGFGAFVGGVVGHGLFVAVGTQAYASVPGGYVLEAYPPTVSVAGVATNAVGVSWPTAVGAFLAALALTTAGQLVGSGGAVDATDAPDSTDER